MRSASITYMIRHYAGRRRSDLVLITRIMPPTGRRTAWRMAGWQSLGVSAETLHAIASDVSAETPCHAAERNPGRFTSRGNRVTSLPARIVRGSRDAAIPLARAEQMRDGLVGRPRSPRSDSWPRT